MTNNDVEPEQKVELFIAGDCSNAYLQGYEYEYDEDQSHEDYMQIKLTSSDSSPKSISIILLALPTSTDLLKEFFKQTSHLWKNLELTLTKNLTPENLKLFINLFDEKEIECPKLEFISFNIEIDDYNKDKDSFVQMMYDFLQKYNHTKKASINFIGEFPKNFLDKIPNHIEELNLEQRYKLPKNKQVDIKIDNDIPFSKIVILETINCDQATINIVKNNTTFVKRKDPIKIKVTQFYIFYATLQKVPIKMEVAQFEHPDTQVPTEIKASKNSTQKTIIYAYDILDYPKSNLLTKRKFISKEEKLDEEELANIIEVEELANIIHNNIGSKKLVLTETKWYLSEPKTQKVDNQHVERKEVDSDQDEIEPLAKRQKVENKYTQCDILNSDQDEVEPLAKKQTVENKYTQCNLFDPPQDEVEKMGHSPDCDFRQ